MFAFAYSPEPNISALIFMPAGDGAADSEAGAMPASLGRRRTRQAEAEAGRMPPAASAAAPANKNLTSSFDHAADGWCEDGDADDKGFPAHFDGPKVEVADERCLHAARLVHQVS